MSHDAPTQIDDAQAQQARPEPPTFEEDIATSFAQLLVYLADTLGAPSFAADVAEYGYRPDALRMMAGRWRECDLTGDGDEALEEFADALASTKA